MDTIIMDRRGYNCTTLIRGQPSPPIIYCIFISMVDASHPGDFVIFPRSPQYSCMLKWIKWTCLVDWLTLVAGSVTTIKAQEEEHNATESVKMTYEAKRCGVQFSPPAIILMYKDKDTNQLRKRIIPVRNFSKYSGKSFQTPSIIICTTIYTPIQRWVNQMCILNDVNDVNDVVM